MKPTENAQNAEKYYHQSIAFSKIYFNRNNYGSQQNTFIQIKHFFRRQPNNY